MSDTARVVSSHDFAFSNGIARPAGELDQDRLHAYTSHSLNARASNEREGYSRNSMIQLDEALSQPVEIFENDDPYVFRGYGKKGTGALRHFLDQFFRQVYLHMLLRIPSMYFTRISRMSKAAIMRSQGVDSMMFRISRNKPFLGRVDYFKKEWENFIRGVVKEWETLNIVSVLLLSALLTMLQINDAASDPITRTAILLSLICAIMSLTYGCLYIVRFRTMTNMSRIAGFIEDVRRRKTSIWWNVLILLAMPAVWLSWSMLFFCVSVMSYVWRAGSKSDNPTLLATHADFGPRAAITAVFLLGVFYFAMIVRTFRSYRIEAIRKADKEASASSSTIPINRVHVTHEDILGTFREAQPPRRDSRRVAFGADDGSGLRSEASLTINEVNTNDHIGNTLSILQANNPAHSNGASSASGIAVELSEESSGVEIVVEPPSSPTSISSSSSSSLSIYRMSMHDWEWPDAREERSGSWQRHYTEQRAKNKQQQDIMQSLEDWLRHNASDRSDVLQSVHTRLESLRDDMDRLQTLAHSLPISV